MAWAIVKNAQTRKYALTNKVSPGEAIIEDLIGLSASDAKARFRAFLDENDRGESFHGQRSKW